MFQLLLNKLSSWSVPIDLPSEEKRITRALSGMIILIWMCALAIQIGTGIFFPASNSAFVHLMGTFTMGCILCLSLNSNGWYKSSLILFVLLLAIQVFIPSWTMNIDADFPYIRFNVACLVGLLTVHVTFVFVKGRSLYLILYTAFILLLFILDSLLLPLFLIEAPKLDLETFISFKLLFVFLIVALIIYTQMVRTTISRVDRRQDEMEARIKHWENYAKELAKKQR